MSSHTDLRALRQQIIRVATNAGEGHIPSSYSVLEIIWTLHNKVMRLGDLFFLSKGHASLALYVVLAQRGLLWQDWESVFCEEGGLLGHPELDARSGINCTSGSLGHGCAMSVGAAYALRLGCQPGTVYCLLGDQELNEGSCYEAMLLAARFNLDNLVWVIDDNQSAERSTPVQSIGHKFLAFGWDVDTCSGHSIDSIYTAALRRHASKPRCVIASTVKGFGVEEFERDPQKWHHATPTADRLHAYVEAVR